MDISLGNIRKVHFIGIGGIGMSALAQLFLSRGKTVSGSDREESPVTDKLKEKGCEIFFDQKADNISGDVDLVVYTVAIPKDNVELVEAEKRGIPVFTYPQMLGIVSDGMHTIAVSGTHGKTTTTAMLADVLVNGGLSPTAIIGSLVKRYKSNFVAGREYVVSGHSGKKYFLVEACEYSSSFLNLNPNILVITNLEADHLDYYKDLADVQSAFRELAEKVPLGGYIVCNSSDKNVSEVLTNVKAEIVDYTKAPELKLKIPGAHNRRNAQAAYAVGELLKIEKGLIEKSLEKFVGTWRRFEYKGETKKGTKIFDDYAHHPDEIQATIQAVREAYPEKKLWIIFQPHMYSRTKDFLGEFQESLAGADEACVVPIYGAREKDDGSISHIDLTEKYTNIRAYDSFEQVSQEIFNKTGVGDIVFTLGAGDVYKIGEMILIKD